MAAVQHHMNGGGGRRGRWAVIGCIVAIHFALVAGKAQAHGAPLDRQVRWYDWNWDPVLVLSLLLAIWLYARGLAAIWDRAGEGRVISHGRAGAFAVGMMTLALAIISPLDLLGEQ